MPEITPPKKKKDTSARKSSDLKQRKTPQAKNTSQVTDPNSNTPNRNSAPIGSNSNSPSQDGNSQFQNDSSFNNSNQNSSGLFPPAGRNGNSGGNGNRATLPPLNNNQNNNMPQNQNSGNNFNSPAPSNNGWGFGGAGGGADPWGSSWNDPWGADPWGGGGGRSDNKKLSPQERVKMIEEVYQQVLGRKPDTRDINYYKYSTLGEDEIRIQLLDGKEHKGLIEDGQEFKKMKVRAEKSETRVKVLERQIKDQLEEFKELTNLLAEKSKVIQQLRRKLNNPYGITTSHATSSTHFVSKHEESYSTPSRSVTASEAPQQQLFTSGSKSNGKKSVMDWIRDSLTV